MNTNENWAKTKGNVLCDNHKFLKNKLSGDFPLDFLDIETYASKLLPDSRHWASNKKHFVFALLNDQM